MAETAIAFIESLSTVAANHHSAQLKLSREHLLKRSTQKPNVSAGNICSHPGGRVGIGFPLPNTIRLNDSSNLIDCRPQINVFRNREVQVQML